jgi:mannose-6-phosphate isomerase-like protein (cupin superfamily)
MTLSFLNPPVEIADDQPVSPVRFGGTPDGKAPGYVLRPGTGPATWFMQALFTMKARALDSDGAFCIVEQLAPQGFAAPGHTHRDTSEAFYVIEGEMDFAIGDTVIEAMTAGSFAYVPEQTRHEFRVISPFAKFLLITAPGGFEKYFEALSSPATSYTMPDGPHRTLIPEEILAAKEKWGALPTNDGTLLPPLDQRATQ